MSTARMAAIIIGAAAFGAATTVAVALVTEAVARRVIRAIDETELADIFPEGWLR